MTNEPRMANAYHDRMDPLFDGLMDRLKDWLRSRSPAVPVVDLVLEDELDRLGKGSWLAARKLPTEMFKTAVEGSADPGAAAAAFAQAIARLGRLLDADLTSPESRVSGVIGDRFRNMNPAVVEVRIAPHSNGGCRAVVTGAAKEGWIKQATAEKSVRRLLSAHELDGMGWRDDSDDPTRR